MTRILFAYRYGIRGGVAAQLWNRYRVLSDRFSVHIVFGSNRDVRSQFPSGAVTISATAEERRKTLQELSPDVLIAIDSPEFLASWRDAGSPGRAILEVHTTTRQGLSYLQETAQLDGVSACITVSEYMRSLPPVARLAGAMPVFLVPNTLDPNWWQSSGPVPEAASDNQFVVWVGKLDDHKRWRAAVDVIEDVVARLSSSARPIVPLFIGGYTAPPRELKDMANRLAISRPLTGCVWWPSVELRLMPLVLRTVAASGGVMLSTTRNESFGMSVAEAVVSGCPVVAPCVGALPELLDSSCLYRSGDWPAAVDLLLTMLLDGEFRATALNRCQSRVESTMEKHNIGESFLRIFREIGAIT